MPRSHNFIAIQFDRNRLAVMFITAAGIGFLILGVSYTQPDPIYRELAVAAFAAGMAVTMVYGMMMIPYRGNMMRHANLIILGEGEHGIHYFKSNYAQESQQIQGDMGRMKTVIPLALPETFDAFPDSPDAMEVEFRHYFEWDERIGRVGDYAYLQNIPYWNKDNETIVCAPLIRPPDRIDEQGRHHWRPTFEVLMTVNKDAANPGLVEAILLAQKMMYMVKLWLATHPGTDPELAYGAVAKGMIKQLDQDMKLIPKAVS